MGVDARIFNWVRVKNHRQAPKNRRLGLVFDEESTDLHRNTCLRFVYSIQSSDKSRDMDWGCCCGMVKSVRCCGAVWKKTHHFARCICPLIKQCHYCKVTYSGGTDIEFLILMICKIPNVLREELFLFESKFVIKIDAHAYVLLPNYLRPSTEGFVAE